MAKSIARQTVKNPQLVDFVNMSKSVIAENPASNLQIDKNNRLYISKKRRGISDKLTRAIAKICLNLGITSIESALRVHDKGRANEAANKFIELARAQLKEAGGNDELLEEFEISTVASYNDLFDDLIRPGDPFFRIINCQAASQYKLDPGEFSGAKAMRILHQNNLDFAKMGKDDKLVFASIYNDIVDEAVSSADVRIDADVINNAVQQKSELLNLLIDKPGFATIISKYHADLGRCLNDMYRAYEEKDASAVARNITAFCCVHNSFMQENAVILGDIAGNSTSQAMLGHALRKAEQDMLASGIDQTQIKKIFTGLQFKIISPVFNEALGVVEKYDADSEAAILNSDQFGNYSETSNIDSASKLTNIRGALTDLQVVAEQLHPYNFDDNEFNAEFYGEKINVAASAENVREGARLYANNYIRPLVHPYG